MSHNRPGMKRGGPLTRQPMKRRHKNTGPDAATRELVQQRSGGRCEARIEGCAGRAVDLHHRKGRKAGGRSDQAINAASNLLALCRSCHEYVTSPVGERRRFALDTGLLVLEHEDPAEVPVTLPQYGPVYLSDDGGLWPADLEPIHYGEEMGA